MLPDNLDKAEFLRGFREKQAGIGLSDIGNAAATPFRFAKNLAMKPVNAVREWGVDQMRGMAGEAFKPQIEAAEKAGISMQKDQNGLPISFDTNQSVNNMAGNYVDGLGKQISNIGGQMTSWLGNHWNQAKSDPLGWAQKNPWVAGGAAALGGAALYGGSKLVGGMFSGGGRPAPRPQPQGPQAYGVPTYHGAYGPQALEKGAEFVNPMLLNSLSFQNQLASQLSNTFHRSPQSSQNQQEPYSPNFRTDDKQMQKLLANPRMQSYLVNLLQQR